VPKHRTKEITFYALTAFSMQRATRSYCSNPERKVTNLNSLSSQAKGSKYLCVSGKMHPGGKKKFIIPKSITLFVVSLKTGQ
jgi:hypothetical protein